MKPENKPRQPKGYSPKPGYKKIAVTFRSETFDMILAVAKKDGISFSEAVDRVMHKFLMQTSGSGRKKGRRLTHASATRNRVGKITRLHWPDLFHFRRLGYWQCAICGYPYNSCCASDPTHASTD
jgi:hypothetical protein